MSTVSVWTRLARAGVERWLPLPGLAVACLILLATDWGARRAGGSVFPGGPLDETAHAVTVLVAFAAAPAAWRRRFLLPALVASVVIDADHVPGSLGAGWLNAGTPRPYPHSLLTVAFVLALALGWRRRRDLLLGVAIGLAVHFFRDMGENHTGVALLWPWSDHSFEIPRVAYLGPMAGLALLALLAVLRRRREARAPRSDRGLPAPAAAG